MYCKYANMAFEVFEPAAEVFEHVSHSAVSERLNL